MIALGYGTTGLVRLISATDGATIRLIVGNEYWSGGIAFSADGNLIAASESDVTRIWLVADGALLRELPTGAKQLIFSGDGERLYALGNEDAASAWQVSDGARLFTFAESIHSESVSVVPHGGHVVIGLSGPDRMIELRQTADADVIWTQTARLAGAIVDVSPDGSWIAVGENYANTLSLRRIADGSAIWTRGPLRGIRQVAFSPDGSEIAVGHSQYSTVQDGVEIFDAVTGDRLQAFATDAQSMAYAPKGGLLAVDLQYGPVQIWRTADAALMRELGDNSENGPLAMAPNVSLLFCHYWNPDTVRSEGHIWSVADGRLVGRLDLSGHWPSVAQFLGRDEILMLNGYASNSYWDVPTQTLLRVEDRNVGSSFRSLSVSDQVSKFIVGSRWDDTIVAFHNPCHPAHGDLDADCQTGLSDLAILLASFGACAGDLAYNPIADIAESGCIDAADLSALLAHFGK